jgi:tetratricopeptide (TPR) repeat protein
LKAATLLRWAYCQFEQAIDFGLRASTLFKEVGAVWDYCDTMVFVQLSLHTLGRWDEAVDIDAEIDPLATRLGNHFVSMVCRRERAARERNQRPDLDRYGAFARADLDLTQRTGMGWIAASYMFLAMLHFWQGRWKESLEHAGTATSLEPPGVVTLWSRSAELLVTAYAGDPNRARRMFRDFSAQLPRAGQIAPLSGWMLVFSAVEALVVVEERAEAAKLYPLVLEAIETGVVVDGYGGDIQGRLLQTLAGMAAGAGGQWALAETHFRQAIDQAETLGLRMERPDLLRFYAGMLVERGRREDEPRIRQFLREAIETYQALSMPRHEELCAQLLHALANRE